jgi:lambda family phage portal protein
VQFESEIMGNKDKPKKDWNDLIETEFAKWGRSCSTDGLLTWLSFQHLVSETVAQDGEVLIRRVRGFSNAHRYAVEIIDADRLDWQFNVSANAQGVRVIMGVEVDAWGKPLAYHIWSAHPYDFEARPQRQRVPAEQIIHLFSHDRARATRGVPWASPVMPQLNMLGRLWSSELAAANAEADRLGIIKTQQGMPLDDFDGDPVAVANEMESEHAQFLGLDPGLDIVFPTIQHPNGQLADFSRALLKGIAAGLGVSYHSLAGDVSDANYSSARVALLDERDHWRKRQSWLITNLHDVVFRDWLEMALLNGSLPLPVVDIEKICCPTWWPRSWDWVDPMKDIDAALTSVRGGLSTYQKELGARGMDWRETFAQLAQEKEFAKNLGLVLDEPNTKALTKPPETPAPEPPTKSDPKGAKP